VANLGPRPEAVIDVLASLGCPCILGNHDEFLLEPRLVRAYSEAEAVVASVDWSRSELSGDELGFVRRFQSLKRRAASTVLLSADKAHASVISQRGAGPEAMPSSSCQRQREA
jgi:hypothetical protein